MLYQSGEILSSSELCDTSLSCVHVCSLVHSYSGEAIPFPHVPVFLLFRRAGIAGAAMQLANGRPPFKALFANQFRMLLILFVTCGVFLLLHNTVGGFRDPSFIQMEQFPKKIWQSWKVDALRFEDRDTERAISWTTKNLAHRYEVLTDDSAMTYVEQFYGPTGLNRPDIVYTYRSLNSIRIIQSDLLRYLIMYAEGGVWADIDVEAVRSIEHFVPKRFNERDINMVIGIETDEPGFKGPS